MINLSNKVEVVLISPDNERILGGANIDPPLGLAFIGAVAEESGLANVRLVDLAVSSNKSDKERIGYADIYGLNAFTCAVPWAKEALKLCKEINPNAIVVIGGPHATARPEEMVNEGFDIAIVGEGEYLFLDVVKQVSKGKKLKDLKGKILKGSIVENLDKLPWKRAYEMVNLDSYTQKLDNKKAVSIMLSRGCPWKCRFCASAYSTARYYSDETAIEMLTWLKRKGYTHFRFYDDTFMLRNNIKQKANLKNLLEQIKTLNIVYRCTGRSDILTYNIKKFGNWMLPLLKESGCINIGYGIESGDQRVLDIYNKNITVEQHKIALTETLKHGIRARAHIIVSPFDTWGSINKTIKLLIDTKVPEYSAYTFIPFPGTHFGDNLEYYKKEYGLKLLNGVDLRDYLNIFGQFEGGFVVETDNCPVEKYKAMHKYLIETLEREIGSKWDKNRQSYMDSMKTRKKKLETTITQPIRKI